MRPRRTAFKKWSEQGDICKECRDIPEHLVDTTHKGRFIPDTCSLCLASVSSSWRFAEASFFCLLPLLSEFRHRRLLSSVLALDSRADLVPLPLIEVLDFLNYRWMVTKTLNISSASEITVRVGGKLLRPAETVEFKSRAGIGPVLCQL